MAEESTAFDSAYARAMAHAAEVYSDVLSALEDAGYVAQMTQTGGMCLAIEIGLGAGDTVLITDKDDILPWDRDDHLGWGIDLYVGDATEPTLTLDSGEGSSEGLVGALAQIDFG
jgi:hypothetical protein